MASDAPEEKKKITKKQSCGLGRLIIICLTVIFAMLIWACTPSPVEIEPMANPISATVQLDASQQIGGGIGLWKSIEIINPTMPKSECRTNELILSDTFETTFETYTLTTGTSVEILARANCTTPPTGMVKVRVTETGIEGWAVVKYFVED